MNAKCVVALLVTGGVSVVLAVHICRMSLRDAPAVDVAPTPLARPVVQRVASSPGRVAAEQPDPDDAVAQVRAAIAHGASQSEVLVLLRALAATNPELAVELATQVARNDDERATWATALLGDWARHSPEASWDWLCRHADRFPGRDDVLVATVLEQMAAHSPDLVVKTADGFLAADHAAGGPAAQIVAQSAVHALLSYGATDEACVIVEFWARSSLAPEIGVGTYAEVARDLTHAAPGSGLAWLAGLPGSAERNVALGTLAADAMGRDPEGTLAWAGSLAPENGRADVMQRAFSEWSERNADAAAHWLTDRIEHNDRGTVTDAMIVELVNASPSLQANPAAALGWLGLMTDPAQQRSASEQLLLRWAARDPTAAGNYVQGDGTLDESRRAQLLQEIRSQSKSGPWFAADAFGQ